MTTLTLANGNTIPQLDLGTWRGEKSAVGKAVEYAIEEAGYRHIDCAMVYRNEKEIGDALQRVFARGKVKRDELFITSKLWNTYHEPERVAQACKQSLEDLQLEYLDLYLVHWGLSFKPTLLKNIEILPVPLYKTWEAMEDLVTKELVCSIGVANYTVPLLSDLLNYARIAPVMNQVELHPYLQQNELVEYCKQHHITVTAYSPLGSRGTIGQQDPILLDDPLIGEIAKSYAKTPAQVLLRWGVQRGTVVIPKSLSPDRIQENAQVFDFELRHEDMEKMSTLNKNYRFVNPLKKMHIPYFS